MGPLIPIVATVAVGYAIWRAKGGAKPNVTKNSDGTTTQKVKGASGFRWVLNTKTLAPYVYVMVSYDGSQGGSTQNLTVLTYMVPAGKEEPRTLVSWGVKVPIEFINAAIKDFGVTVPKGVELDSSPYKQVKGPSGTTWEVYKNGDVVSVGITAVNAKASKAFAYDQNAQVVAFKTVTNDPEHSRVYLTSPAGLPSMVLFTALSDFDIAIPKGMVLPGIPSQQLSHLDQLIQANDMAAMANVNSVAATRAQSRK